MEFFFRQGFLQISLIMLEFQPYVLSFISRLTPFFLLSIRFSKLDVKTNMYNISNLNKFAFFNVVSPSIYLIASNSTIP